MRPPLPPAVQDAQAALEIMLEWKRIEARANAVQARMRALPAAIAERYFDRTVQSGITVSDDFVVEHVEANSPAANVGIQPGDRVLAVNGVTGSSLEDRQQMLWNFRSMNAGDYASVTVERAGEEFTVSHEVMSAAAYRKLKGANWRSEHEALRKTPAELARARQQRIIDRQWNWVHSAVQEGVLGAWDGLLLMDFQPKVPVKGLERGVLVIASEQRDHPLLSGDLIGAVGGEHPNGVDHAVELLYGYSSQPQVPLLVYRAGAWLEFELPYPEQERLSFSD